MPGVLVIVIHVHVGVVTGTYHWQPSELLQITLEVVFH